MDIWPIPAGYQSIVLNLGGLGAIGIAALGVTSALRRRLPLNKVIAALSPNLKEYSRTELLIHYALVAWFLLAFFILAFDVQVHGFELGNLSKLQVR